MHRLRDYGGNWHFGGQLKCAERLVKTVDELLVAAEKYSERPEVAGH